MKHWLALKIDGIAHLVELMSHGREDFGNCGMGCRLTAPVSDALFRLALRLRGQQIRNTVTKPRKK